MGLADLLLPPFDFFICADWTSALPGLLFLFGGNCLCPDIEVEAEADTNVPPPLPPPLPGPPGIAPADKGIGLADRLGRPFLPPPLPWTSILAGRCFVLCVNGLLPGPAPVAGPCRAKGWTP